MLPTGSVATGRQDGRHAGRHDGPRGLVPPFAEGDRHLAASMSSGVRDAAERELDQVLTDSFPASDPPSWTLGVAQPDHDDADSSEAGGDVAAPDRRGAAPVAGGERSSLRGLVSLLGAAGLALLLPVVILLVGTPVVTAVRGVAHAVAWLLARVGG